jgi:hypothetical protein
MLCEAILRPKIKGVEIEKRRCGGISAGTEDSKKLVELFYSCGVATGVCYSLMWICHRRR